MLSFGYISKAENQEDKMTAQVAEFRLKELQTQHENLKKYTFAKEIRALQARVGSARSEELAARAAFELERSKLEKVKKNSREFRTPDPELLILDRLNEAASIQDQCTAALHEIQSLEAKLKQEPADSEALTKQVENKQAQAARLSETARTQLADTILLLESFRNRWRELLSAEAALKLIFYSCALVFDVTPFVMDRESTQCYLHSATTQP